MEIKFKSIVDELCDYVPNRDRDLFIENRAQQVIASIKHLRALIESSYDNDTAEDLLKRLINAARTGDENKFTRKIREIRENKNGKKKLL